MLLFIYLFRQYLDRGAQFSEAGLNGALFNINLHTNNVLLKYHLFGQFANREAVIPFALTLINK